MTSDKYIVDKFQQNHEVIDVNQVGYFNFNVIRFLRCKWCARQLDPSMALLHTLGDGGDLVPAMPPVYGQYKSKVDREFSACIKKSIALYESSDVCKY